jgi:hypothetical protein
MSRLKRWSSRSGSAKRTNIWRARSPWEDQVAACLYPAVIAMHDAIQHDDRPWIVMEPFPAWPLASMIDAEPLPACRVADRTGGLPKRLVCLSQRWSGMFQLMSRVVHSRGMTSPNTTTGFDDSQRCGRRSALGGDTGSSCIRAIENVTKAADGCGSTA